MEKNSNYQKLYRETKIKEGKCVRCSNTIAEGSASRCRQCLDYAKQWQHNKTEKSKQKQNPDQPPAL